MVCDGDVRTSIGGVVVDDWMMRLVAWCVHGCFGSYVCAFVGGESVGALAIAFDKVCDKNVQCLLDQLT